MQIREYVRPADLDEAYALLTKRKNNYVIGGCTFLKRTRLMIGTAIDLGACGLDYIEEREDGVAIGASTCLRDIETSPLLKERYDEALTRAVEHLIGVQLRNAITIGGHVASRFGFSDIIPTLMALGAVLKFHNSGEIPLAEYMTLKKPFRDILVEIRLPKAGARAVVQMMRKSYNDYSIFCLSAARTEGVWTIAAGVFPGPARLASEVMADMNGRRITAADAPALADRIAGSFTFGSNYRGAAEYRRELCRVFARRAVEELADAD